MNRWTNKFVTLLAVALLGLSGCTGMSGFRTGEAKAISASANRFASGKSEALRPIYEALYVEGEHNAVLNFEYLGLAAMEAGDYGVAEKAFDEALSRVEAIYANDPNAEKAKTLWNEEKVKDFKGEPYERSMAYYYRGLLYLRAGDYQNARAMFLSAERHDTLSEKERFQSDFGVMNYLAAWSSFCDGDTTRAGELHTLAMKADPQVFGSLRYDYTFLGLIDAGTSPTKASGGKHGEFLVIRPSALAPNIEKVFLSGAKSEGFPVKAADINFQATTRGARPIQSILDGKAQFKEDTATVGEIGLMAGTQTMLAGASGDNSNLFNTGAIISLVGIAAGMVSDAITPAADTRYWAALPSSIYLMPGVLDHKRVPGFEIRYTTPAQNGQGVPGFKASAMSATNGKCGFSWGRTHSAFDSVPMLSTPVAEETGRVERNREFRTQLLSSFGGVDANGLPAEISHGRATGNVHHLAINEDASEE